MHLIQLLLYNLGVQLYAASIHAASLIYPKAKLWIEGRKNWQSRISNIKNRKGKRLWFHCASLGEFEQARPLIEKFTEHKGKYVIIVTFFSPSGYEVQKNYISADAVTYLPLDTPQNAKEFLDIIAPDVALFVKYEFWYHYLNELDKRKIPTILFSSIFRKDQIFFKLYGGLFKEMLKMFTQIFVQSKASQDLLSAIHIESEVAFDTRFDRVYQIANLEKGFPLIEKFKGTSKLFIAGSTWQKDEELMVRYINENLLKGYKFIIAPHQIDAHRIEQLKIKFIVQATLFSELSETNFAATEVLLIDNIGILSSLYSYGDMAYIGGGFNAGVHNVLEAAVHSMPILFGPHYFKSLEAIELKNNFAAFPVSNYQEFKNTLNDLTEGDQRRYMYASLRSKQYVKAHLGGAEVVSDYINHVLVD